MDSPLVSLSLLAILLGSALVSTHFLGLISSKRFMVAARSFPRSKVWGTALLSLTTLWLLVMTATTDLGEFSPMRHSVMLATAAGAILLWKFVPDFLSSRCLGFLLLLAAHPVLEITFLKSGFLHFAVALLAYAWAIAGLFLVGMPYLHRDLIGWICQAKWRWDLACWAGILYGLLLLIDGLRLTMLG
jgi:hypothetical protein